MASEGGGSRWSGTPGMSGGVSLAVSGSGALPSTLSGGAADSGSGGPMALPNVKSRSSAAARLSRWPQGSEMQRGSPVAQKSRHRGVLARVSSEYRGEGSRRNCSPQKPATAANTGRCCHVGVTGIASPNQATQHPSLPPGRRSGLGEGLGGAWRAKMKYMARLAIRGSTQHQKP